MMKRNNWYKTCLISFMFLGGCGLMAQQPSLLIADFEHQKEIGGITLRYGTDFSIWI